MTACTHPTTEPVIVLDEEVARVCPTCLDDLPAGFGCSDCTWATLRAHGGDVIRVVRSEPCAMHGAAA